MKYTPRQFSFAQYLLRRIGFLPQEDINAYLQHLLLVKGRYHFNPKAKNPFKRWHYSAKACMDALLAEVELKKSPKQIALRQPLGPHFSATSLARYAFCAAAFSIADSFEQNSTTSNEWIELGDHLHQTLRLSAQHANYRENKDPFYRRAWQNPAIGKIMRSEPIYMGHAALAKLFFNDETGFVGSPDYIFNDRDGLFFVVEEKFIQQRDPMNPSALKLDREELKGILEEKNLERQQQWEKLAFYFFDNHILQVLAYLYNLVEYPLSYGYLVYWLYDFKDGEPYVHKAGVKKLSLTNETMALYQRYLNEMQTFKEQGNINFDVLKVNAKKCAACSLSPYCMHKTKRFNAVHYPYRSADLRLYAAEFPSVLRSELPGNGS